jgi:hypothetical protein
MTESAMLYRNLWGVGLFATAYARQALVYQNDTILIER